MAIYGCIIPLFLKDFTLSLMIAICFLIWASGNFKCLSALLSGYALSDVSTLLLRSRPFAGSRLIIDHITWLELALHLFGYVKKKPNRRIVLHSRPSLVDDELSTNSFHPDFLEDYPDACEDVDPTLPKA